MSIKTEGCWGLPKMGLLSQSRCRPLHKPTCRKRDHDQHSHQPSRASNCRVHPPNKEQPKHKAMHQSSCTMSIKREGCWG